MTVDLLCRVVDNLGDIGVAWRLARALRDEGARVRLVVEGMEAFRSVEPSVDADAPFQERKGVLIRPWASGAGGSSQAAAFADYLSDPPRAIIECFACGRPDWLEDMLFGRGFAGRAAIVDLEYLSAEDWVPGFHKLPSVTRSAGVRKWMFMPGFGPGTGGLTMGRDFGRALGRSASDPLGSRQSAIDAIEGRSDAPSSIFPEDAVNRFWFLAFSYELDYSALMAELARFSEEKPCLLLSAPGRSRESVLRAWEDAGKPFPLADLPYLPQPLWDELILAADFAIVRGEDSLSRAALGGNPFIWQAYPQDADTRLEKARALGGAVRRTIPLGLRPAYTRLVDAINGAGGGIAGDLLGILRDLDALKPAFRDFAGFCASPGELERNLLTFLGEIM